MFRRGRSESNAHNDTEESVRPRRSRRLEGGTSMQRAFQKLQDGDYEGFMNAEIMSRWFDPAKTMTKAFGHGSRHAMVKKLWMLYWNGNLEMRELPFDVEDDKCLTCGYRRHLRIMATTEHPNRYVENLGYVGVDCFEIRFQLLMNLTDACKQLLEWRNSPRFDEVVAGTLDKIKEDILMAPLKMKERYAERFETAK